MREEEELDINLPGERCLRYCPSSNATVADAKMGESSYTFLYTDIKIHFSNEKYFYTKGIHCTLRLCTLNLFSVRNKKKLDGKLAPKNNFFLRGYFQEGIDEI